MAGSLTFPNESQAQFQRGTNINYSIGPQHGSWRRAVLESKFTIGTNKTTWWPLFIFFGYVEDVYTVNVVYISINIHDKPNSHPLYIKISVLELGMIPMYMYLMCCFWCVQAKNHHSEKRKTNLLSHWLPMFNKHCYNDLQCGVTSSKSVYIYTLHSH